MENSFLCCKFNIELNAPIDKDDIPHYCEKIRPLFNGPLKSGLNFAIASKPSGSTPGFIKSYNLAKFLLNEEPDINILLHLTCRDLDKKNIGSRLSAIKALRIKRILVITGDDYSKKDEESFTNSEELIEQIIKEYNWFDSVGAAGYPSGNKRDTFSDEEELERLRGKLNMGVDTIHTQCIFSSEILNSFGKVLKKEFSSIEIVPSVAIFQDKKTFEMVSRLTRVDGTTAKPLAEQFNLLQQREFHYFSLKFLVNLCKSIICLGQIQSINVCTFNQFEIVYELLASCSSL